MQRFFRANILREVIFMPYKFIRHILLLYPAAGIIVRIFIARAVPQRTCTGVMRVAQMLWHRALHRTSFFTRTENCRAAGVAFWCICYIAHGLRQRQLCFRQAYKMCSLRRGISHNKRHRVSIAHIFCRADNNAPRNKTHVLAAFQHLCQIVQRRVRV